MKLFGILDIKNKVIAEIAVGLVLAVSLLSLVVSNAHLRHQNKTYRNNEIAIHHEIDSLNSKSVAYELSIRELEYLNDSISLKMKDVVNELNVEKNKVRQIQYVETVTEIHDSLVIRDTIFKEGAYIDTSLTDSRWYTIGIKLSYPGTVQVSPSLEDELYAVMSDRKEIAGTPSKLFFIRWFQKKQIVTQVDIHNSNPYVKIGNSRFVNITK